ncbi:MAG: hypothetical protein ACR2G0_01955 [Chthoniobacterales bacterium]
MRRNSIQLSRRHEWVVYGVSALVFATGSVWAWLHYFGMTPGEFGEVSPAETWILKAHGGAAMAMLIMLGTLFPMHVKFAWRARRNLRTGLSLCALLFLLIMTGYGLYYAGGEHLRAWTSSVHLWIGLLFVPVIALHAICGKRSRAIRNLDSTR